MMRRFLGIAILAFVGLVLLAIGSTSGKTAAAVSTPAAAAAPAQPDPHRVAVCENLLKQAPAGSWRKYSSHDGYGTVVVGPTFSLAPFEGKEALDGVFRCLMADGRKENEGIRYVEYLDPYTHKEIAKWSQYTGFSVD